MTKLVPFHFGVGKDKTVRLFDDAINSGQAKTGALPHFLGGEEGFEDFAKDFGRDTAAGVANFQGGVIGDRHDVRSHFADFGGGQRKGLQRERAAGSAPRHGVAGVDGQINDDLFKLPGIGADGAEAATMLNDERHRCAEQSLQEV